MSDLLAAEAPLLRHVAVRSAIHLCATAARSVAARPRRSASDLPAALLASGGSLVIKGPNGERVVTPDFFTGFLETALADDEMVTEIRAPKAGGVGWSYQKFNRRAQDGDRRCSRDGPDPKVAS